MMDNAEIFCKKHFPGLEKETWYPAIVAIAEGYAAPYISENQELRKEIARLKEVSEADNDWIKGKFTSAERALSRLDKDGVHPDGDIIYNTLEVFREKLIK